MIIQIESIDNSTGELAYGIVVVKHLKLKIWKIQ
jgi:hypothetical protein